MWISDVSIRRPVFATMFIVSFMVLGIVSMTRLGIDLFPDVSFPFVNVAVVYPGASPEEVETLVTKPIEDAVAGINGVKRVQSRSTDSLSTVGVELRLEVDAQNAAAEVREKVAAIRGRLPKDIEDPTIVRFDVAGLPIMTFAVGSNQPSDVTRRQIEDDLKPLIEQIDGVAAVEVNGGDIREVQVDLDPGRLEALGLPVSVVADKLAAENLDVPGGRMTRGGQDAVAADEGRISVRGRDRERDSPVRSRLDRRVGDVGHVVDGYEERTSTTRLNGCRRGVVLDQETERCQYGRPSRSASTPLLDRGRAEFFRRCRFVRCMTMRNSSRATSRRCAKALSLAASWRCS
jgi:multidrug efflux pump subunit AcrB